PATPPASCGTPPTSPTSPPSASAARPSPASPPSPASTSAAASRPPPSACTCTRSPARPPPSPPPACRSAPRSTSTPCSPTPPRATREGRVAQVLERRVAGPFFVFAGEDGGVRVEAHLPHPTAAARGRGSPFFITRQRVVRERSLGQILAQAYGLGGEAPSACVFVEPPPSAVDVNVHPQKAEVRFSEPQQVYAAVRRVLAAAVAAAPWAAELASGHAPEDMSSETSHSEGPSPQASSRPGDALLAGGRGMAP